MKIVSHIGFHKDVSKPSLSKSTAQTVLNLKNALSTIQSRLQSQDFTGMTRDDILRKLLYTTVISYYAECDRIAKKRENEAKVVIARLPSEATFSVTLSLQNSTIQW